MCTNCERRAAKAAGIPFDENAALERNIASLALYISKLVEDAKTQDDERYIGIVTKGLTRLRALCAQPPAFDDKHKQSYNDSSAGANNERPRHPRRL